MPDQHIRMGRRDTSVCMCVCVCVRAYVRAICGVSVLRAVFRKALYQEGRIITCPLVFYLFAKGGMSVDFPWRNDEIDHLGEGELKVHLHRHTNNHGVGRRQW